MNVVLYDPDDPSLTPIPLTGDHSGQHAIGSIAWDPAAGTGGEYTLVTVRTDSNSNPPGHTWMEVFQRDGFNWVFRYEFDAHMADSVLPTDWHVTSPEPFVYGSRLYIAFVAADAEDFMSSTKGNIMITRVEEDSAPSDHYRVVNACDNPNCELTTMPTRKRIEPEIHYLYKDRPVIFYSLTAGPNDAACAQNVSKLMRALPGVLWTD